MLFDSDMNRERVKALDGNTSDSETLKAESTIVEDRANEAMSTVMIVAKRANETVSTSPPERAMKHESSSVTE